MHRHHRDRERGRPAADVGGVSDRGGVQARGTLVGQVASTGGLSQQGVLARVRRAEHGRLEGAQLFLAHPGNAEAAAVSVGRRSLGPYEALPDRGIHARIPARRPARVATTQREQGQWQAGQNDERTGRQELAQR